MLTIARAQIDKIKCSTVLHVYIRIASKKKIIWILLSLSLSLSLSLHLSLTHTHAYTHARAHCLSLSLSHTHTHTHTHTYTHSHALTRTHTHTDNPDFLAHPHRIGRLQAVKTLQRLDIYEASQLPLPCAGGVGEEEAGGGWGGGLTPSSRQSQYLTFVIQADGFLWV